MKVDRRLTAALVVVLLVLPAGALVAAGQSDEGNTTATGNGTDDVDLDDLDLQELRSDGTRISEMNPSERPLGRLSTVAALNYPTGALEDYGDGSFEQLTPDTVVNRKRLQLFIRSYNREERDLTVHVVYWREGTRTEVRNGTRTQVPTATDLAHDRQQITVSGYETLATVDLRTFYDQEMNVLMWIDGHRDETRWVYSVQTSETLRPVQDLNTAGGATWFGLTSFLLPAIGGLATSWGVASIAKRRVLVGPMQTRRWWLKMGVAASMLAVFVYWDGFASLLISMKWVSGLTTFAIGLGMVLDQGDRIRHVNIRQLMTTAGISSSDRTEISLHSTKVDAKVAKVIEHDGDHYVVAPGLRRLLARAIAGPTKVENYDALENVVEAKSGSSYDEEWHLDPEVLDALDLSFPRIGLGLPDAEELTVQYVGRLALAAIGAVGLTTMVTYSAWDAAHLGYLGLGPVILWASVEPIPGTCRLTPASVMQQRAETTNIALARDYGDATTNDELRTRVNELEARSQRERIDHEEERRRVATDKILESRGARLNRLDEQERDALHSAREEDKQDLEKEATA